MDSFQHTTAFIAIASRASDPVNEEAQDVLGVLALRRASSNSTNTFKVLANCFRIQRDNTPNRTVFVTATEQSQAIGFYSPYALPGPAT
jgi:hypothetical protein